MEQRQVSTPKEFFVKERDQFYADWQLSFWREFFQNSVDAGAKNISISVGEVAARGSFDEAADSSRRRTRVVFEDDGCGMTADVLDKVYFAIGQTTKNDGASVGGYGRARLMTCFSQARYSILTTDRFVLGDGPNYVNYSLAEAEEALDAAAAKIAASDAFHEDRKASHDGLSEDLHRVRGAAGTRGFKGCRIEIDIDFDPNAWSRADPRRMLDKLRDYLSESQLPCAVTVNGKSPEETWAVDGRLQARRGPAKKTLEAIVDGQKVAFATVHTSEGDKARHKGKMIVRVDGASMYSQGIETDTQVIVEVSKDLSRAVLTSNRDGMKRPYREALDEFIAQMNIDTKSALADLKSKNNYTISGQMGRIQAFAPPLHDIALVEVRDEEMAEAEEIPELPSEVISTVDHLALHGLSQDAVYHLVNQTATGSSFLSKIAYDYTSTFPLKADIEKFTQAVSKHYGYRPADAVPLFLEHASDRLKAWVARTLAARERKAAEDLRAVHDERLKDMHDVHVSIISSNDRTRAAIRRNDPRKWDVASGKGRGPRALLSAWTAACAVAVETLFKLRPSTDPFQWTTGWVYSVPEETHQGDRYRSASVKAMCQRDEGGNLRFLLNPVRDDGSLRYSVSDPKDRQRLQALAMHEVAHVLENYHNETYAGILTDLMEEYEAGDANRRMKDAVRAVMAAYEAGRATVQAMDREPGPRPAERLMAYANGNSEPDPDDVTRNRDGTWSYEPSPLPAFAPEPEHEEQRFSI